MNGTIVNALAIMAGSLLGIFLKTGFFKAKSEAIISALGLLVLVIGLQGLINADNLVVLIVSLALGSVLGEAFDVEGKFNRFASKLEKRFSKNQDGRFAQGLISATLLFGVGALAIVGSLESGLFQNETLLYTKSTLDFVTSIVFASSFGWGVFFSFIPIVIYQGSITLFSVLISGFLTDVMVSSISSMGSVLIMALGLNMMNATKFKVANLLPSLVVVIIIQTALSLI